jgi:hypothetical protein
MKILDRLCAGAIALLALGISFLIPRAYPGRIWIFGTDLAMLFAAMLNWLRIQNRSMRNVKMFCITANVALLVFFAALMTSIGMSRTLAHAHIPVVAGLLLLETGLCLRKDA